MRMVFFSIENTSSSVCMTLVNKILFAIPVTLKSMYSHALQILVKSKP